MSIVKMEDPYSMPDALAKAKNAFKNGDAMGNMMSSIRNDDRMSEYLVEASTNANMLRSARVLADDKSAKETFNKSTAEEKRVIIDMGRSINAGFRPKSVSDGNVVLVANNGKMNSKIVTSDTLNLLNDGWINGRLVGDLCVIYNPNTTCTTTNRVVKRLTGRKDIRDDVYIYRRGGNNFATLTIAELKAYPAYTD